MMQGELIIALLLSVIAYFLYHIAKQLSYLTGHRIKFRLPTLSLENILPKKHKKEDYSSPKKKLPN